MGILGKTESPFSSIAIDQTHEQINVVIKGVGSAAGLLSQEMDAALPRWETACPEGSLGY